MEPINPNPIRTNNVLIAAALCIVAAGAFKAMIAITGGEPGPVGASAASPLATGAPIGSLVGRDHTIHILNTPEGTRYTIRARTGEVLVAGLTADEATSYLGHDPRRLEANSTAIMLADDKHSEPPR
ncbi:MAG: hypothetical protein ACKVW3_08025 [Phycisphaerales bacterium]